MKDEIEAHLSQLIGMPLVMTWRVADMRIFHFGKVRPHKKSHAGEFALHIQCAWRLDNSLGIITGRSDLFHKPTGGYFSEEWDYSGDTLQDIRLKDLLGMEDPVSGTFSEAEKQLAVERVQSSPFGDAEIFFSKGYRLVMFPAGTKGEAWRLFRPGTEDKHFVVEDGSLGVQ